MSAVGFARRDASAPRLLLAGTVSIGLALLAATALRGTSGKLETAVVISLAVYGLLLHKLFSGSAKLLCVPNLFGVLWVVWFPLRLLIVQADRQNVALHPLVRAASDDELVVVWLLALLGFICFSLGVGAVRRASLRHATSPSAPALRRSIYLLIAIVGLGVSWVQTLAHVRSGILGEVGSVFLLGIAGAAFLDVHDRHFSWTIRALVGAGVLLGIATSFKSTAVAPLIAWSLGSVLGGLRISRLRFLFALLVGLCAFAGVQGQRLTGGSNPFANARSALFDYDLRTGLPARQADAGAAFTNLLRGVANRTAGADALVVVRAKTPSMTPFQRGKTLWEPAASVLPGVRALLDENLNQLSLGRYFSTQFWSVDPANDPSSQAITLPGDLYLNFGTVGVAAGMLAIGLLCGGFERRFPSYTALGAGVLAYAGMPLAMVESNVAYSLVTAAMRLAIVFGLLMLVGRTNSATA